MSFSAQICFSVQIYVSLEQFDKQYTYSTALNTTAVFLGYLDRRLPSATYACGSGDGFTHVNTKSARF